MSVVDNLSFGLGSRLPLILQNEATECGLACLAMLAGYHEQHIDLLTLRRRFSVSLKGATLVELIRIADKLGLGTRALKLDLEEIEQLRLPCVLHWNFNHFVVLKKVAAKTVAIHDPAIGERKLRWDEVSKAFTGVALEAWPAPSFHRQVRQRTFYIRNLLGHVSGLVQSGVQILLLAAALEMFALVSPFFLQWVVDNVVVSSDRDLLTTLALGFSLLMFAHQAISSIRSWVLIYFSTTLNLQWRANIFTHLLRLPVQYFEKRHLGDIVSRFGAIDLIQRTLTTSFLEAVLDGAMASITLATMLLYSPKLGSIAIMAMALYATGRLVWYLPLRRATEEQIVLAARQQSHFLETVRGIKVIKLFQRQDERRSSWIALLADQINAELRTQKLQLFYRSLNGILFGIENVLIIWLGARLILDGSLTVGALIAFNAFKGQFDSRVSSLIDKFFELKMLQLQGDRLADIILTERELQSPQCPSPSMTALSPSIAVRNLRFRYADSEPYVLDGVDLEVPAGESIAIVGASGCGKTTLMNVLLGILPDFEGEVQIGSIPLKVLGVETLRKMVGTVLQDDVLFAGSIADNISFFDANANQAWIRDCAQMAAIDSDINVMPMGYNTLVGDMGTILSGGQRQRILLARALYKRPKILFLDEATSHLDIPKERLVNNSVRELNMTRVIIAHRPETIASADRVVVLADGKILRDSPVPIASTTKITNDVA